MKQTYFFYYDRVFFVGSFVEFENCSFWPGVCRENGNFVKSLLLSETFICCHKKNANNGSEAFGDWMWKLENPHSNSDVLTDVTDGWCIKIVEHSILSPSLSPVHLHIITICINIATNWIVLVIPMKFCHRCQDPPNAIEHLKSLCAGDRNWIAKLLLFHCLHWT